MAHELAGTKVQAQDLIDVDALTKAYYENIPDVSQAAQRVSFGTSGHRGKSLDSTFTDAHVAAIAQAICDGRKTFGASDVCFVGQDTHALSQAAFKTVQEVLAGNGVSMAIDANGDFVPTPSVSRAILRYNLESGEGERHADGIVITPSHNPPDCGGIKYNPTHGGPAEEAITKWIEAKANEYLANKGQGIKRMALDVIPLNLRQPYEYKKLYVDELPQIIDIEAIRKWNKPVLVNALGGSGMAYWQAIRDTYGLPLTIINDTYDPTFSFMSYDHDGKVRMDCSSAYAMAEVTKNMGHYALAVGNDPDYDRFGIVTQKGLVEPNHVLAALAMYLFSSRKQWIQKGVGKTVVGTQMINEMCDDFNLPGKDFAIPLYEVPVGFKYFARLLYKQKVGLAGEESAGASFLKKDGSTWTTDKDGIIVALAAMEMTAVLGRNPQEEYDRLAIQYGKKYYGRIDTACTREEKAKIKKLRPMDVVAKTVAGDAITDVRNTARYEDLLIGGLRIDTAKGWVVARPSGTEDLYKVYGESKVSQDHLQALLDAGAALIKDAVNK